MIGILIITYIFISIFKLKYDIKDIRKDKKWADLLIFINYLFFLSVTNSFSDVARPANPWISLGIIIFVASPFDNSSRALNPCKVK